MTDIVQRLREGWIKPLFKHQKATLTRLKKCPEFFDMSEPGTGKTRVEIEDFTTRRAKNSPPAIVLATRSTLESAWADDFKAFSPALTISIAYANNREQAFQTDSDVFITNHDAVNWLVKQDKKFWKKFEGGSLIVDESTAMKHHTSQRSKNLAKISKHFAIKRMMSGLADPNGVLDLWHQFYLLDGGKRLGKTFFGFRSATCIPEQVGSMPNMVKWIEKEGVSQLVAALIKDISIKHKLEECVDMPPNVEYTRSFDLNAKHRSHYLDMQETMVTEAKGKVLSAVNKAVLRIKLLQIASGAIYNNGETDYTTFDTGRYELVQDLAQEVMHSVVFFQWIHQRDELVREAKKRSMKYAVYDGSVNDKERAEITKAFQAGELDQILAHPKSAAHGLTWVKGTRTIWASPTDNLEFYKQGLRRIYRIGQTQKTETITIIAKNTYDEIAYERLTGKALRSDEFSDKLRRLL